MDSIDIFPPQKEDATDLGEASCIHPEMLLDSVEICSIERFLYATPSCCCTVPLLMAQDFHPNWSGAPWITSTEPLLGRQTPAL